jgi:hypothetical protein
MIPRVNERLVIEDGPTIQLRVLQAALADDLVWSAAKRAPAATPRTA